MTLFLFFSWALVTVAAVTLPWPVNVPLAALAYKMRQGQEPVGFEPETFWWRSTFAALGLSGFTLFLLWLAYALIVDVELPWGPVHLVLFMAYVPAAAWYFFWIFALEDMLQGLSVFLLYVLVPAGPLLLVGRIAGFWTRLAHAFPWLLPLKESVTP